MMSSSAGPGTGGWGPRGVSHALKVESESARLLVLVTPGGFEQMFEEGGVAAAKSAELPEQAYDPEAAIALSKRFGFEVVAPQLALPAAAGRASPFRDEQASAPTASRHP
jgi:hypothetical protein